MSQTLSARSLGRLELHSVASPPRAFVDQRLKRVLDDGFGQRRRGVVGAGAAARRAQRDIDAAGQNHQRALEGVFTNETDKGLQAVKQTSRLDRKQ